MHKRSKKNQKKKKSLRKETTTPTSVESLIEQGNTALTALDLDLAYKSFDQALQLDSNDTNIMDALADVCMQLGDLEKAFGLLQQSTAQAPSENPFKWMFLAQLQNETESVESYQTGIHYLKEILNVTEDSTAKELTLQQIAKAYCSIAEIYLTDLCYEDDAETRCEAAINDSLLTLPENLDGLQAQTSLRISQNRKTEASVIIEKVADRIIANRTAMHSKAIVSELLETETTCESKENPEIDFCSATAKLLIECSSENQQLGNKAIDLLVSLLEEDDENLEIWYLIGVASLNCVPIDLESARFHLEQAKDMMDKYKESMNDMEFPYEEQYNMVLEQLKIVSEKENSIQQPNETSKPMDEDD